jgi:outer membrane protein with beta-barrel domain
MRKALVLGVLGLAGTLASPAFAADEFTGFRLGITLSSDKLDGFYNHSVVNPPSPTSTKDDSTRFGYSLFGGWAMNKWLAVEGGYAQGTEFSQQPYPAFVAAIDTTPATEGSEYYLLHQQLKSAHASVVGSWWVTPKFSVFGRAGFLAWRGKVSYAYGDFEPPGLNAPPTKFEGHASDDGFAPLFGAGIQTQLDHALIRLEYTQADVGDIAFGSNFSSTDNTYSQLAFSIVWTL